MRILILIALVIVGSSGCSTGKKIGHWVDTYPRDFSVWQCVESFAPHRNKEC